MEDKTINKLKSLFKNYSFIAKVVYQSNKWVFIVAIFSTLALGIIPALQSLSFKNIIAIVERSFKSGANCTPYSALLLYIISYICILILKDLILDCRIVIYRMVGLSLTYNIQTKIIEKLRNIEYYMFYRPSFQNLYSLVLRSSDNEPLNIIYSTLFILSMSINLISFISIIACFNIWILLLLTITFLPSVIIKFKIQKENVKVWDQQAQNNRFMNYYFGLLTEKDSIKEVREYGLYGYFNQKRYKKYKKNLSVWQNFSKKEFKRTSLSQLTSKVGILISILWLIFKVLKHQFNIADLVFYGEIILSIQDIYTELTDNIASHYTSMLFMNKFFEFIQIDRNIKCGSLVPTKDSHTIEFKNVWFKYEGRDKYVLQNINCAIKTGDRICIVGHNGCGKTTLVSLILRIYDPVKGEILLDGINIKEYDMVEYRKLFCEINQDYIKYMLPINECIALGDINNISDLREIKAAAKQATADKFIDELEQGYNTNLTRFFSDDGIELSGGQWQKLSIARVFFSNADILIFDEPTSALDPESEAKIYKEIEKEEKDKIKIFISHRMYSSKGATRIIMMADGKILDTGDHNELMVKNKEYQNIFNAQAERYANS